MTTRMTRMGLLVSELEVEEGGGPIARTKMTMTRITTMGLFVGVAPPYFPTPERGMVESSSSEPGIVESSFSELGIVESSFSEPGVTEALFSEPASSSGIRLPDR